MSINYNPFSHVADLHFHDIRAKALTDAERQGCNAQQLASHESRAMTDGYIKHRQVEIVDPLELAEREV
jgi:hypothetical protein